MASIGLQHRGNGNGYVDHPVLEGEHTFESVTEQLGGAVIKRPYEVRWFLGFAIASGFLMGFLVAVTWLFYRGLGIWGINIPVMWAFDITNFVWWIGIGHAGTLISAILLLLKQDWRTSINRFAEAMTLFAVACAGLFPLIHLGRPWLFYWLLPYPNTMGLWPQWRSPLVWDVFAVSTYGTVSLFFWYIGLIPDVATLRDRARTMFGRYAYGFLSLGWTGSAKHWHRYRTAYVLLAGLSTPLVVSVHTVVSFDFSTANMPGWHTTVFPPYFVAGAIYSGFAMVATLMIPLRTWYGMQSFITIKHIDRMAKVMLATGLIVTYGYFIEAFMAWYSGNPYESNQINLERPWGHYAHTYWLLLFCNCTVVQLFWFRWFRTNPLTVWIFSLIINTGMWLERYIIIVVSLHKDFLPSSWSMFHGTIWDYMTFYGTIGFFMTLVFLFVRFLPAVSIAEVRELVHEHAHHGGNGHVHPAPAGHGAPTTTHGTVS
jgi:molybdopterin-containing oxidoreductase family membrane subunit